MIAVSTNWKNRRKSGSYRVDKRVTLCLPVKVDSCAVSSTYTADYPATAIIDGDRTDYNEGPAPSNNGLGRGVWWSGGLPVPASPQRIVLGTAGLPTGRAIIYTTWAQGGIWKFRMQTGPTAAGPWTDMNTFNSLKAFEKYNGLSAISVTPGTAFYFQDFEALVVADLAGQDSWVKVFGPSTWSVVASATMGGLKNAWLVPQATASTTLYRRLVGFPGEYDVEWDMNLELSGYVGLMQYVGLYSSNADGYGPFDWAVQIQETSGVQSLRCNVESWGTQYQANIAGHVKHHLKVERRLTTITFWLDGAVFWTHATGTIFGNRLLLDGGYDRAGGRVDNIVCTAGSGSLITVTPANTYRTSHPSVIIVDYPETTSPFIGISIEASDSADGRARCSEAEIFRRFDVTFRVPEYEVVSAADVEMGEMNARELSALIIKEISVFGLTLASFRKQTTGAVSVEATPEIIIEEGIDEEWITLGWFCVDELSRNIQTDSITLKGRGRNERGAFERSGAAWIPESNTVRGRIDELAAVELSLANVNEGFYACRPDPQPVPLFAPEQTARDELVALRKAAFDRGAYFDGSGVLKDSRITPIEATLWGKYTQFASPDVRCMSSFLDVGDPKILYWTGQRSSNTDIENQYVYCWNTRLPYSSRISVKVPGFPAIPMPIWQGLDAGRVQMPPQIHVYDAQRNWHYFMPAYVTAGNPSETYPAIAGYRYTAGVVTYGSYLDDMTGPPPNPFGSWVDCAFMIDPADVINTYRPGVPNTAVRIRVYRNVSNPTAISYTDYNVVAPTAVTVFYTSVVRVAFPTPPTLRFIVFVTGNFTDGNGKTKAYQVDGTYTGAPTGLTLLGTVANTMAGVAVNDAANNGSIVWLSGQTSFMYGGTVVGAPGPVLRWDVMNPGTPATATSITVYNRGAIARISDTLCYFMNRRGGGVTTLEKWDGTNGTEPTIVAYAPESYAAAGSYDAWAQLLYMGAWYGGRSFWAWKSTGHFAWFLDPIVPQSDPTNYDDTLPAGIIHTLDEKISYELGGSVAQADAVSVPINTETVLTNQSVYDETIQTAGREAKMVQLRETVDPASLIEAGLTIVRRHARFPVISGSVPGSFVIASIGQRMVSTALVYASWALSSALNLLKILTIDNRWIVDLAQGHNIGQTYLREQRQGLGWMEVESAPFPEVEPSDILLITYPERALSARYKVQLVRQNRQMSMEDSEERTTMELTGPDITS